MIHTLSSQTKNKKRVGRGGKRGTYSGKGQKGQKSRAGRNMRPGLRDLIIRIPKKKGYKNKPKSVTLSLQAHVIAQLPEETITPAVLYEKKLITKKQLKDPYLKVRVVASSKEVTPVKKTFEGISLSSGAAKLFE